MERLTAQNFDRLAKAIMERHGVSYVRAREMLGALHLRLICGEEICESTALQAALLTAINTGKRAFRGGVTVSLAKNVPLRVPWPGATTLNEVIFALGAQEDYGTPEGITKSLLFGDAQDVIAANRVVCDGWRAVLLPPGAKTTSLAGPDFSLGGVFAGAFAVAQAFLSAAEISHRDIIEPVGLSLWRPDLCWLDANATGPALDSLPAKLWLLGLGHLGQAYGWTLGLLPFSPKAPATIYLQDYDEVEDGNWSAGLFCEPQHVGALKTRLAAGWFEQRGFGTRLIERAFDKNTKRTKNEPRVALCGFDNPESRQLLEDADFELVVDAGLGASLDHFDRIVLRTFPDASQKAREIFHKSAVHTPAMDPALFEDAEGECGIVFQEIAGKAISSSFTGACASALVVGEVLRAMHGGRRCEFLSLQLRDLERPSYPYRDENYQLRVARNGIVVPTTIE
jgi:hypothetical protein